MLIRGVAVLLLLMLPGRIGAQQAPPDQKGKAIPGPMDLSLSDSASRRIAQSMAVDLGNLRKAEVTFYATHHVYAYTLAELAPFALTPGNSLVLSQMDGGGYKAVIRNPGLTGAEAAVDGRPPSH
jgi:hypothetical protein